MGALISVVLRLVIMFIAGLVLAAAKVLSFGAVVLGTVVAAVAGIFGEIFDFPDLWVIVASVIAFGVVAYLVDRRKRNNVQANQTQSGIRSWFRKSDRAA